MGRHSLARRTRERGPAALIGQATAFTMGFVSSIPRLRRHRSFEITYRAILTTVTGNGIMPSKITRPARTQARMVVMRISHTQAAALIGAKCSLSAAVNGTKQ